MKTLPVTAQEITNAINEGKKEAFEALNSGKIVDGYGCGFAWLEVYTTDFKTIRTNSKIGKLLESAGLSKDSYSKAYILWNPAKLPIQNIDGLEKGAEMVLRHLKPLFDRLGLKGVMGSRLD